MARSNQPSHGPTWPGVLIYIYIYQFAAICDIADNFNKRYFECEKRYDVAQEFRRLCEFGTEFIHLMRVPLTCSQVV